MPALPFRSENEELEFLREHNPQEYDRRMEDRKRAHLQWLKDKHFEQWVEESAPSTLRDELKTLESQKDAILAARPDLENREHDILRLLAGPLEIELHTVTNRAEAVKAELIGRGEPLKESAKADSTSGSDARVTTPRKMRGRHPNISLTRLRDKVIELYKMNRDLTPKELAELPAVKDSIEVDHKHPANFVSKTLCEAKKHGQI
jgi:hypothetical protein